MNLLELRRQFIHMIYGPIIVLLFHYGLLDLKILFGIIVGGSVMSLMVKRKRMNAVRWILSHFEREHHMENFPGRGVLFFTIGAFIGNIIITMITLISLGVYQSILTKQSKMYGGLIILFNGSLASTFAFLLGWGIEKLISKSSLTRG